MTHNRISRCTNQTKTSTQWCTQQNNVVYCYWSAGGRCMRNLRHRRCRSPIAINNKILSDVHNQRTITAKSIDDCGQLRIRRMLNARLFSSFFLLLAGWLWDIVMSTEFGMPHCHKQHKPFLPPKKKLGLRSLHYDKHSWVCHHCNGLPKVMVIDHM